MQDVTFFLEFEEICLGMFYLIPAFFHFYLFDFTLWDWKLDNIFSWGEYQTIQESDLKMKRGREGKIYLGWVPLCNTSHRNR